MNKIPSISFLLGSGISLASGMPSVSTITNAIQSYYGKSINELRDLSIAGIGGRDLLDAIDLIETIDSYIRSLSSPLSVNYEDIYELLNVYTERTGFQSSEIPISNMAFIKELKEFFSRKKEKSISNRIVSNAKRIIESIVKKHIPINPQSINGLDFLTKITKNVLGDIDILTLNHDYVLETDLKENGIPFEDGMIENGDIFKWEENGYFDQNRHKTSILKLHGGIDWEVLAYYTDNGSLTDLQIGIVKSMEVENVPLHIKGIPYDRIGKNLTRDFLSAFITGKRSKAIRYNMSYFSDIFSTMGRLLKKHNLLVIAGYGFSDDAINHRIRHWFNLDENRKIVVFIKDENTLEGVGNILGIPYIKTSNRIKNFSKFPNEYETDGSLKQLISEIISFSQIEEPQGAA